MYMHKVPIFSCYSPRKQKDRRTGRKRLKRYAAASPDQLQCVVHDGSGLSIADTLGVLIPYCYYY